MLPLYLMMLGALFIAGELAHARQTLLAVERTITWIGADRYPDHELKGILRILAKFVRGEDFVPPKGDLHVDESKLEGEVIGNTWLNLYVGYAVMDVQVPWWHGLANTGDVLHPEGGGAAMPFDESYVVPENGQGQGNTDWRSAVVRRRPNDVGKAYQRNAAALALADYVEPTVASEPWIVGGEDVYHELPDPAPEQGLGAYRRIDALIVLAE